MSTLTAERVTKYLIGVGILVLCGVLLLQFANLVIYLIIALIITYALDPIVNRMEAAGMNRTFSVMLTIASLALILVWISTNVFPVIAAQMIELARQLNVENLQMIALKVEEQIHQVIPFIPQGYL
jgi:predicted PurR-regulated permease PerM